MTSGRTARPASLRAKNCTPRSLGLADRGGRLGGRDEGLRGHDVGQHRRAADAGALDERDVGAELGAGEGGLVAAGPAAEDREPLGALELVGHAPILPRLRSSADPRVGLHRTLARRTEWCHADDASQPARRPRRRSVRDRRAGRRAAAPATGVEKHDIALTLGSGWGQAAELIGETTATIPATEIVGFSASKVVGHVGTLRSILLPTGKRALVIGARTHYYEGHGVRRVVHSVRTAAAAGATTMVLTNGAGGIKEHLEARHPGADQRPHQPDRRLPARGRDVHRPHRPVLEAPARPGAHRRSRASTRACTCSSAARTTRPPPRCRWRRRSAATSSACRPRSRRSPPAQAGMEILGISLITNLAAGISKDNARATPRCIAGGQGRRGGARRAAGPRSWRSCERRGRHRRQPSRAAPRLDGAGPRPGDARRAAMRWSRSAEAGDTGCRGGPGRTASPAASTSAPPGCAASSARARRG